MTEPVESFTAKPPEGAAKTAPQESAPTSSLSQEEKSWGMYCHLAALAGLAVPGGSIIGPLICWLIKKDVMPFADRHGKESVNFQLNILIYVLISIPIAIVTFGIGFVLTAAIGVYGMVMPVIAGMKANEGQEYQYPYTFRLLK
jgi:uncharacterized Tic20 family protein